MVPITFRFIILLNFDVIIDRLHPHEISRQMCHDNHQHSELFQDINWIHDEKYHPCPWWIVLSSATLLPSLQHKLVRVLCCTLSSLLPSIVLVYLEILPPFMSRMSWEFHHLLRILGIVILLTITILSWSSCWFQPGYQQVNGVVWILHF